MLLESQGQPVASMDFGPLIHLDPSGVAAPLPRRAGVCASTLRAMQVTLPHPPTHVVLSPQPPASAPATCRATGTPWALGARWAPAIEGRPRPATCVAYAYEYANLVGTLILILVRIRLVHGTHRAAAPEYILGCFWRLCELDTFVRLE